jgi:predicted DNA-binding ArsR family transcriptional regulator
MGIKLSLNKASDLVKSLFTSDDEETTVNDVLMNDEEGKSALKELFEQLVIQDMLERYEDRKSARLPLELSCNSFIIQLHCCANFLTQ